METQSNVETVSLKIETPVKTARLGDATLQRGYIYSCQKTGEEPELEDGHSFGFHGTIGDPPPCAAEYLCDFGGDGYLVISSEEEADSIVTVAGWTLTRAEVESGDVFDDGTWCLVIVKDHGHGEFTVAGTL